MSKLLRGGLHRLRAEKVFWIIGAAALIMGIIMGVKAIDIPYFDDMFIWPYYILIAIGISVFTGSEYSYRGVSKKIIIGHGRASVYSGLIIMSMLIYAIISVLYFIPFFLAGYAPVWSLFSGRELLMSILGILLTGSIFAVIFGVIGSLVPYMTLTLIINMAVLILFVLLGYKIHDRLSQPKEYEDYHEQGHYDSVTGEYIVDLVKGDKEPNPGYLEGNIRKLYESLDNILPGGQFLKAVEYIHNSRYYYAYMEEIRRGYDESALNNEDMELINDLKEGYEAERSVYTGIFLRQLLYDVLLTALLGIGGGLIFSRKNLL